ncbi:MAG: hypothetical protein C0449_05965 [Polaromonas sp.]|nr:hypothetical protein [Polaromonas sp.]
MRAVRGQDGVASGSCAVRVSGQVVQQAQEAVVTLPAKLEELTELMGLMNLAEPVELAGPKQLAEQADQNRPLHRRHNPAGDGLLW